MKCYKDSYNFKVNGSSFNYEMLKLPFIDNVLCSDEFMWNIGVSEPQNITCKRGNFSELNNSFSEFFVDQWETVEGVPVQCIGMKLFFVSIKEQISSFIYPER